MTALSLSFLFIVPMLLVWSFVIKKFLPILLFFPIAINSYTLFFNEGLMWVDIGLLLWLCYVIAYLSLHAAKKIKIGPFSYFYFGLLLAQITINILHYTADDFYGSAFEIFVTPMHMYLPFLALVLILENKNTDVHRLWSSFDKLILPMTMIMAFTALIAGGFVEDVKQIPGVAASAGFVAIIYPLWLAYNCQNKGGVRTLGLTFVTFIFLILSRTRGALLVCVILAITVVLLSYSMGNRKQKKSFMIIVGAILATLIMCFLFFKSMIPDNIYSIVNLYKGLYLSQGELVDAGGLNMDSGDIVRFALWNHAVEVWLNNFIFGLGNAQFDSSGIFGGDRADKISPHHAILSVAVDGGLVALIFNLLPQLYLLSKTRRGEAIEERMIFHFAWLHVAMSFILGYAFSFIIVIAFYLTRFRIASNSMYTKVQVGSDFQVATDVQRFE